MTDQRSTAGSGPAPRRIQIFDTTLRDGEQSPGCSMNADEKVRIARALERLGVDVIEAGFPIASPGERAAVAAVAAAVKRATVAALCRATEEDILAGAAALAVAVRPRLHVFLATSDIHLRHKLRLSRAEALRQAESAVRFARSLCAEVEFSAEDASRSDPEFLCEVLQAAHSAGALILNVPDTVGYALPEEYGALIARVVEAVPGAVVSAHCHDDLGLAVANSLAAVSAGAGQIEGTLNGIGERAGNTSLEEVVMALEVRRERLRATTGVRSVELVAASRTLSRTTGVWPQPNKAIVGRNAFAHEAGIHQHGVLANPLTYEIMTPESVGADGSSLVLGKHSGRHAVASRLRTLGVRTDPAQLEGLTAAVKALAERKKFVYDDDLLALLEDAATAPGADDVAWRPLRLVRYQALAGNDVVPTATVEIEIEGERRTACATGNGTLDAALSATAMALGSDVELLELHTRAVTGGTDALAEVIVRVRRAGREACGQAASTDTLEAALKAFLSAAAAAARAEVAA
jgi:2-isopropylmalate synthase